MKQTALEWFAITLSEAGLITKDDFDSLFKQAKEMEEKQHQETFKQSRLAKIFEKDMPPVWESWEQYYNKTFKSE